VRHSSIKPQSVSCHLHPKLRNGRNEQTISRSAVAGVVLE
jgi:hypothetical protein